jgi:hypothetical protein
MGPLAFKVAFAVRADVLRVLHERGLTAFGRAIDLVGLLLVEPGPAVAALWARVRLGSLVSWHGPRIAFNAFDGGMRIRVNEKNRLSLLRD